LFGLSAGRLGLASLVDGEVALAGLELPGACFVERLGGSS
jgi:hypothetical protein